MSRVVRMPYVVVAVLVAAVLGLLLGSRLPWGQVPLTVEEGVVVLHDKRSGFSSFDGEDGTQFGFDVGSVYWSTGEMDGERGVPPCMRAGKKVPAQVGYRWVRLPDGGARMFPLWLAC